MKMRNKGKVYPSPSSSSLSYSSSRDSLSVLNLLPAAVLALISVLSLEDREALAYMITRSIKSSNPSSIIEEKKRNKKKLMNTHKPPLFDCDCFDCYTSYWFKWDSSPNRELIHMAIEAFEEHLSSGEQAKKNRGKKREKLGHKKLLDCSETLRMEAYSPEKDVGPPGNGVVQSEDEVMLPGGGEEAIRESSEKEVPPPEATVVLRSSPANSHKGLARKVLPDVVGLFNSRLWSLWGPNA